MNKLSLKTLRDLIKLRNKLGAVSQISWSFSVLNKQSPIGKVEEEDAQVLITAYQEFIQELQTIMEKE